MDLVSSACDGIGEPNTPSCKLLVVQERTLKCLSPAAPEE